MKSKEVKLSKSCKLKQLLMQQEFANQKIQYAVGRLKDSRSAAESALQTAQKFINILNGIKGEKA